MNKYCVIPLVAMTVFSLVCAAAPKNSASSDALVQARIYKYQFRAGQYDVVPRAIEVLERASAADPDNVELLTELGTAYLMRMTAVSHPGGQLVDLQPAIRRAWETFSRAAEVDPTDAYALAGRGMSRIISRRNSPAELKTGIEDLNAGVERDPSNLPARLMRAFTLLSVSSAARDVAAVESDLAFLGNVARGTKAADVLSILLADLQLESGRVDSAIREYERLATRSTFAGDAARARLASFAETKQPPTKLIARLREDLGRQCTMCHGQ